MWLGALISRAGPAPAASARCACGMHRRVPLRSEQASTNCSARRATRRTENRRRGRALTSSPCLKAGDSPRHREEFPASSSVASLRRSLARVLHQLHRRCLPASPAVGSQSWSRHLPWLSAGGTEEREEYIGQHAHAFTQASDLAWNPQTRLGCQGTTHLFYSTCAKMEMHAKGGRGFLPLFESRGFRRAKN